jgi:hypothetical protein
MTNLGLLLMLDGVTLDGGQENVLLLVLMVELASSWLFFM